jgi:hypothetical protein
LGQGEQKRQLGRSIGALFAGFIVVVILSLGADEVLHLAGVFPPWGQPVPDAPLMWATAYRTLFSTLGSYITARFAPYRPMLHAMVGGAIGLVLATAGAAATWNAGPAFGGHWYPLALVLTALPTAWAGGRLRELQLAKSV